MSSSIAADGKRKWTEMDWEVVLEAQSFVAIYAASSDDEEEDQAPPPTKGETTNKKASNAKRANKTGSTRKNAKGKATIPQRSGRKGKAAAVEEAVAEEVVEEEEGKKAESSAAEKETFWLAELLDDVTEDMLETDVGVRVRWLQKRTGTVYKYAFDDVVEVQTILCHVYMHERNDGSLELTAKSLARVERCVKRTRGELPDDEMDDDDEKPPPSRRKRRAVETARGDKEDGGTKRRRGGGGGGGRGGGGGTKKLSKREEAMHIPPKYATVDLDKYEDTEIRGKQALLTSTDDTIAISKEVIRAVVTKNHKMLKKLTEDKNVYKMIYSFSVPHGPNVKKTALQYAVEADDLTSATLLLKARKLEKKVLAKKPDMSLPSHSTGKHTSSYSDYNRRAINASRGGREGNNALVEDGDVISTDTENEFLWFSNTSVKMLTLFYPTGEWSCGYSVPYQIGKVCRSGNYKLAFKLIETLQRNGGWGFNDLHVKVLADSDDALPAFRSVSAIKQAYQTKIRPLHLAAINPNTKYLEALWDSVGDEWSSAKDDLAFEPIHFAAACESTAPLAFLLERKCNMFARTKRRQTPIMRALATGREENAIFIMEKASEESEEILSKVVSERGPGSFQPIHYAANQGGAKALEHLIKSGADVNSVCEGKLTPLCLAAREGHYDCVKVLLDHEAKVNQGDKLKKTPLIFAVKNGHTRIAALLINAGANVNAFDTSENSAVHYAASYGWKSCLNLLADAGADFWAKNSWGFVPLTCALLKQRLLCSEFILERDPNQQFLDFRDRQGCTMLFLQCKHSKNVSQIKYLLDKGLNPNIPNSDNVHPLQVLLQRGDAGKQEQPGGDADEDSNNFHLEAIRLLLESKALPHYDIEVKKPVPGLKEEPVAVLQPLQIAVQRNFKDEFLLLLDEYGADPTKQGYDGMDTWMTATWFGRAGEFYLEVLLKHHTKKHKNKKLAFATQDVTGDNIFHCIAANDLNNIISSDLIVELIRKCENPVALFNQKNNDGLTPLQKLLENEREKPSKDIALPEHADILEEVKHADERYSKFVEIFAQYATSVDAWVRFVDEHKAKTEVSSDGSTNPTDPTSDSDYDDDKSSQRSDDDEDKDEEIEEDDEDEDEDDEDSDDEDDNDGHRAKRSKPVAGTGHQGSKKLVRYASLLHAAANRKLRPDAKKDTSKWFGSNLVSVLLHQIRFDEETINFPDYHHGKTALDYAVQHGDVESVAALLNAGADPNHSPVKCVSCTTEKVPCTCPRDLVETALVVAIRNNNVEIVRLLLESGRTNLNCFEKGTFNRPLHLSLLANSTPITSALIEHKADLTKLNATGSTALHLAVQAYHSVFAKQPHEGEVQYTNLSSSIDSEDPSLSAISVALQSDQAKHVVMSYDAKKRTPVHLAAANRDLELLRVLVGASANKKICVNKGDQFGRTPLHFAVNASSMSPDASFEVERFLLQSGADPNTADEFNFTALHFALFKVKMDWHFQYDVDKDKAEAEREREAGTYETKKRDAFLKALATIPESETDPVETVSNLASIRGIKSTSTDILGRTPLHLAAATGAFVCASAILSTQSDATEKQQALSIVDKEDFTPLGRAVQYLRQTTIMTFLQNGAQVNGKITLTQESESSSTAEVARETHSYFYHAVKHSLTGICHMLLNAKFSKRQAVEDAILCGQFQLASNLMVGIEVSSGIDILVKPNSSGDTLLHSLARVDKPFDDLARKIAWSFVDAGLKADRVNNAGCSALHYAAELDNIHMVDFLLHNKCDINKRNKEGETPVVYALKRSKMGPKRMLQVVSYFVEKADFDIHIKDSSGVNILSALIDRFVATKNVEQESFYEWVEKLLKKGVDPNGVFSSSRRKDFFANELFGSSTTTHIPPLIRVAYAESSTSRCNLLGLLLRFGAKVNTSDSNGNSLLMHLAAGNKLPELHLAMGKTKTLRDPVDPKSKKMHTIHVPASDVKAAVAMTNKSGQTVLHIAVKPLIFGSHENTDLIELFVSNGANLQARDKAKQTPVDYTLDQASRFLYRFLRTKYPKVVTKDEGEVFDDEMEDWEVPPNYVDDATAYIEECEKNGKITKTRLHPEPNSNCDVGSLKRVFGEVHGDDKVISGEEYDALLTKVDVKNGRFGLNVFYRCQIVHDQIQGIYVVFTNWGRIGEEGKFQNTPFHSIDDAVMEFKKIFRSKTGNHWHERHDFVKHAGKYNLVQRVSFHTKLSEEVTIPFVEAAEKTAFVSSKRDFATSVSELLFAITDVRNLQLAASENAKFQGSLPLANTDELRAAVDRLVDIRGVIETRDKLNGEMDKVRGDLSDTASSQLAELSKQHSELTEEVSEKSSRYYEVMPCNEDEFGSSIKAFNSVDDVNIEITRLRMLIDITHTYKMLLGAKRFQNTVHPLDYCYDALQVNIAPLPEDSHETKLLIKWFFNGLRPYDKTRYRISNVFQVSRNGEKRRFFETMDAKPTLKNSHSQLLWHGTKRTNLMGILSQGLRIAPPEAPHHGYMYGKGLYFANVAAKSLAYCDSGYTITSTSKDPDGNEIKKKRNVHYLLACQVALGTPKELTAAVEYGKKVEDVESVRAVGQHLPDPTGAIVSPLSGASLSLGKVGQIGVAYPYTTVWAKTQLTRSPWTWFDRNPTNTGAVQELWAKIIENHGLGETYEVEDADEQKLFFSNTYNTRVITVEVVSKDTSNAGEPSFHSDAVLKITVKSGSDEPFSWQVKRLRNAYMSSPVGDGFELIKPEGPEYDELIVYDEGQARIRYLVEVETL